ncbi:MAG: c-type cytochrome [Polyangia bacterium]
MRIAKVVGGVLCVLLVMLLLGGLGFLRFARPLVRSADAATIERTPQRLERGKYLAEVVINCMHCHSEHDDKLFGWPAIRGTYGRGGFAFDRKLGMPGSVQAQNITSDPETGLGAWTDGEILRAMREGIAKNGRALFPMMPYEALRKMSDEDARSIVVYLRSLPPAKKAIPDPQLDFPVSLLVRLAPQPVLAPVPMPNESDHVAWGEYLVTLAGCVDCHTNHERGKAVAGMEYGGGWVMTMPWGRIVTPNISPDPETGIGNTTREAFIGRFKAFESMTTPPPAPPGRNTIMPWVNYSQMSEAELGAMYDYLRTVPPVKNKVANVFPDAG